MVIISARRASLILYRDTATNLMISTHTKIWPSFTISFVLMLDPTIPCTVRWRWIILKSGFFSLLRSLVISASTALSTPLLCANAMFYSYLYQFQKLGDDDNEPEFASTSYPSFGMTSPITPLSRAYFRRRPLDILALADEYSSSI